MTQFVLEMNCLLKDSDRKEEFLCERGGSVCFRLGDVFRKYYKHGSGQDAKREGEYSRAFEAFGLNTPRYFGSGFSAEKKMYYSDFQYREFQKLSPEMLKKKSVTGQIKDVLEVMRSQPACSEDGVQYWKKFYLKDLRQGLSYLDQERHLEALLGQLERATEFTYMHGDFSLENIGVERSTGKIIVYDFQMSGAGVRDWDEAYFLSSIPCEYAPFFDNGAGRNVELVRLITAVKLGRGIRKQFQVEERKKNFAYWRG